MARPGLPVGPREAAPLGNDEKAGGAPADKLRAGRQSATAVQARKRHSLMRFQRAHFCVDLRVDRGKSLRFSWLGSYYSTSPFDGSCPRDRLGKHVFPPFSHLSGLATLGMLIGKSQDSGQ